MLMMQARQAFISIVLILCSSCWVSAEVLRWSEVLNSDGAPRTSWDKKDEYQKAEYLELYFQSIKYCQQNIGKRTNVIDSEISGPRVAIFYAITYETISMLYREYGDFKKSADYMLMFWEEFKKNPNNTPILNADGNPTGYVINAYKDAGMYIELLSFYPKAYEEKISRLSLISNIHMLKYKFSAYKKRWPKEAKEYERFMKRWKEAKLLAGNSKPKPLDVAVQNHEWFYSDKREEVLKALAYYHDNKVDFMLEKALAHKDPVVAARAKEYLEDLKKGEKGPREEAPGK